VAIIDTGATNHYVTNREAPLSHQTVDPISILLPNGDALNANRVTQLPLNAPTLPPEALRAYIVPNLQQSLISIGQFCDHDCEAHLTKDVVTITHKGQLVLTGPRDKHTGL
jgi:hypothetical protein